MISIRITPMPDIRHSVQNPRMIPVVAQRDRRSPAKTLVMKNACHSEILIPGKIYTAAREFALIGFKVAKARPRLANFAPEGPADFPGG